MPFEDLFYEDKELPWAEAASLLIKLSGTIPPVPKMSLDVACGKLKLARLTKQAQPLNEEDNLDQYLADPQITAALDYDEQEAERNELIGALNQMQTQLGEAQQAAAQADQTAQQTAMQAQQGQEIMQQQLAQVQSEREIAIQQAVQARDQAMSETVAQQAHRKQIMDAADQLTMQLKQVAAMSPADAQMAQQEAAAQAVGAQPSPAPEEIPSQTAKSEKEKQEAQNAQQQAQIQTAQAERASEEDAARLSVKTGAANLSNIVQKLKDNRIALGILGLGTAIGAGRKGLQQAQERFTTGGKIESDIRRETLNRLHQEALRKAEEKPGVLPGLQLSRAGAEKQLAEFERKHPGGSMGIGALQGLTAAALAAPALQRLARRLA